ncbi:hypothetical protein KUTeg_017464 [Tegillarca granosa]|uniref:Uncharacterized protein n=1 Tax=Tegillarca granosa TaxID=220873 RepID=A0ABQ9EJ23_TEGGR|nr:hypothetical protein KUTeg_017464 [Tegillarca granosa]
MFNSTTTTTSSITTDQRTDIYSTYGSSTNGISTLKRNEQNSTAATTTTIKTTTTTTYKKTDDNQGLPLYILLPVVGGGALLVILIIVIVCCIVKRKQYYDKPGPKADPHSYVNRAVVPDKDDDDGDEMRDNELYRSIDDEPNEESHSSGYAEVISTGIRLQNTAFDVGDYAKIDEPTNSDNLKVNYSDHSKNHQNVYSTPLSRPVVDVEGQANASKLSTNKKPPVVAPKLNVVKSESGIRRQKRNADRLHYSDLELSNSRNTSRSLNFNIGDKTGHAENNYTRFIKLI